ncbi:MAG: LysE family translocator [Desulfobacter sp.]|nr:LysE family translocator [Desulfobacter sp.]
MLSLLAITGLGMILESSKELFLWLQYMGAAYLCFIGIKIFITKSDPETKECPEKSPKSVIMRYVHGIGVSMVNPKALGFFSALFLPFINPDDNTYFQFIILILTLLGCSTFSLFFYSIGAQAVSPTIKKYYNTFNKITGSCFIGLSLMLARSSSKA